MLDAAAGAQRLKALVVLNEFIRLVPAIVPGRSLTSPDVKGVLAKLFARHGRPEVIRSDTQAWQDVIRTAATSGNRTNSGSGVASGCIQEGASPRSRESGAAAAA